MNKKLFIYFIAMYLSAYSQLIYSDEGLPDIDLTISLDVVNITCNINDGKDFNKIVDFETINENELLAGTQPAVKIQLIVDCQKSGVKPDYIDIKMKPGAHGALNNGASGGLKTNLAGVGINLSWLDGSTVDLSGANKRFNANNQNQFDISFFARPYAQGEKVGKGIMKSSVIVSALYK